MDLRIFGLDEPLISALHHVLDFPDELEKIYNNPTRAYVRDAKAMASTPADVKEYPKSYVFVVDMPGVKSSDIKVQVEDKTLVISGERKREEEKDIKYIKMERRIGKHLRKFQLPDNANTDAITAVSQDGVLTVTVEKLPPPEPKKAKTVEVKAWIDTSACDILSDMEKAFNALTRTYVRDAKAMTSTPLDVEYRHSYVFSLDMPGLKCGDIKVEVEDDNVLVVSGEQKREDDRDAKYINIERRVGKFMRKFSLPDNVDTNAISAVCQDGVLTAMDQKLPPPEPKKLRIIDVKVA